MFRWSSGRGVHQRGRSPAIGSPRPLSTNGVMRQNGSRPRTISDISRAGLLYHICRIRHTPFLAAMCRRSCFSKQDACSGLCEAPMIANLVRDCWFLTGPTASGKSAVGRRTGTADRGRNRLAGLDGAVSRHGHRHGETDARGTPRDTASSDRRARSARGIQPGPIRRSGRAESRRKSPAADGRCCSSAERRFT